MTIILEPCSKLKLFSHWQKIFYPDFFKRDIKLDDIYRSLDILSKHKGDIESGLYKRGKFQGSFFSECDVVLYDLTTLRFESVRKDLDNFRTSFHWAFFEDRQKFEFFFKGEDMNLSGCTNALSH